MGFNSGYMPVEEEMQGLPVECPQTDGIPPPQPFTPSVIHVQAQDGTMYVVPNALVPELTVAVVDQAPCEKKPFIAALIVLIGGFLFPPLWFLGFAFVRHKSRCVRRLGKASLILCVVVLVIFAAHVVRRAVHRRKHHHRHHHQPKPCPISASTMEECFATPRFGCGWCGARNACTFKSDCEVQPEPALDGPEGLLAGSWIVNPDAPLKDDNDDKDGKSDCDDKDDKDDHRDDHDDKDDHRDDRDDKDDHRDDRDDKDDHRDDKDDKDDHRDDKDDKDDHDDHDDRRGKDGKRPHDDPRKDGMEGVVPDRDGRDNTDDRRHNSGDKNDDGERPSRDTRSP